AIYNDRVRQHGIEEERLASQLLTENDPFTEFLLMDAIDKIKGDAFIQNRLFSPYTSKDIIRQKIRRVFLNTYLDRYDIQIHLFNSLGEPFEAALELINYRQMKDSYQNYQTNNNNIYFISRYDEGVLNRYLTFVDVRRYNQVAGYVLLDLRLKRIIPNSVYPLLLTDNRFVQVVQQNKLSYGIFDEDNLIFNYGDFNYQKNIDASLLADPALKMKEGIIIDELRHRVFSGNDGKSVVISSKPYPLLRTATNFSFLFLLFVISILIILLIISIYVRINNLKQNYASRIQMFLNVAYFVPLLIVCITIVSVILQSYRKETELQYLERARNLSTRISSMVKNYQEKRIDAEQLRVQISEVAGFAELDINIFNTGGRLLVASQPLIYENELLSEHINPLALVHIAIQHDNYVVLEENVGELTFKNTYFGIKSSETGELIGILSLPFFDFRLEYEQNVIVVLMNVMNIFTFIFLIFLFGSYFASRWLTFPLRLITQKIRRTTLAYNEPLAWNSDDEIGLMVGEYNKMLENLEESRKALARSEKESAWHEMARQVAHEIKNPLTPMQLTLQHMRRTVADENDPKTEHRLRQIDSLLHQISTLSDIATSFSEFAKMPVPGTEEFEFSALLRETIELYDNKESGKFFSKIEPGSYLVLGDRQWIGRAISNIIINGLQSVAEGEKPVLRSQLVMLKNKRLLLSILDNGVGISEEIRDKIFIPNFSTKPNGSGIGLAIARRGIEHAGGKIWFESEPGNGTTFFIELPIKT
ncbi:MAG: ATP-binding protein, partial [Cyclobacteriaceae bacterium]